MTAKRIDRNHQVLIFLFGNQKERKQMAQEQIAPFVPVRIQIILNPYFISGLFDLPFRPRLI